MTNLKNQRNYLERGNLNENHVDNDLRNAWAVAAIWVLMNLKTNAIDVG
jgi:hypothetical protein